MLTDRKKTKDLTRGDPLRLILAFTLPMMAGRIFEQLYNITDTIIIGRTEGVAALTAVSAAGWLDWLVLSITMALAEGVSLYVSQRFGAKDMSGLKGGIGQGIFLGCIAAGILTIASQAALCPLLRLLNTPPETFQLAERYLRVIFAGTFSVMAYGILSGFLRAMGNSRTPFIAMAVSSVANILLDCLFIAGMHMGVEGAALATVIAQSLSALICFLTLRGIPEARIRKIHIRPSPKTIKALMILAAPVCIGNLVISSGGLIIQRTVNGYGLVFMAGYNAAGRLSGMMELAGTAIGSAVAAFSGQNKGACRFDRIREGVRKTAVTAAGLACLIGGTVYLNADRILRLFIEDDPEMVKKVLTVGKEYLGILVMGLPGLYLLFIFRSALQGMGYTARAMLSGGVELLMRTSVILILPPLIGTLGVFLGEPAAWNGAMLYLWAAYLITIRKETADSENKSIS